MAMAQPQTVFGRCLAQDRSAASCTIQPAAFPQSGMVQLAALLHIET